jgi:hypothetical protein
MSIFTDNFQFSDELKIWAVKNMTTMIKILQPEIVKL